MGSGAQIYLDWFSHSEVDEGEHIDSTEIAYAYFHFFKIR
jgi:hypothetical protein